MVKDGRGWHRESARHAQAARGIKTTYVKSPKSRETWLVNELFKAGGKGRWIDDSSPGIPVHHVLDLERGIEVVEEPQPHVRAVKLYDETPEFALIADVWQVGKAGGYGSSIDSSIAEKWKAEVLLMHQPYYSAVPGPKVGYNVFDTRREFNTEEEARAAADRGATKFLHGRTFEKAVEDEFSRTRRKQEEKWAEQHRRSELFKMLKKLPKV